MNLGKESEILEFKKSTSELDEGIISLVAMLNKHGEGTLYFGVKNNGDVVGQKQINENTLRDVSRRISEKIKPQIIPHISLELIEDKEVIKVYVKGRDIPYTAFEVYYSRSFDEDKKLAPNEIKSLINFDGEPDRTYMVEADNQNLSFKVLKGLYITHGLNSNTENFEKNIGLYTRNGKYNVLAELLADENRTSIKVVTFKGTDKSVMLKRNEYGGKCLITSVNNVLEYMESINETKVKLGGFEREEEKLFDFNCFKEAWLNAVVHNRWVNGAPPAVYIYDDKIEIVSDGGLPSSLTIDDYFSGVSKPVNEKMLRIFSDLDLIERTGHGVPMIVKKYGKDIFKISKETIRIFIPLNKAMLEDTKIPNVINNLNESEVSVLELIKNKPNITQREIAETLKLNTRTIGYIISSLKRKGYIERIGSNKSGYWSVLK